MTRPEAQFRATHAPPAHPDPRRTPRTPTMAAEAHPHAAVTLHLGGGAEIVADEYAPFAAALARTVPERARVRRSGRWFVARPFAGGAGELAADYFIVDELTVTDRPFALPLPVAAAGTSRPGAV